MCILENAHWLDTDRFPKSIDRNPVLKENKEYNKENVFVFNCLHIYKTHVIAERVTEAGS